MSDLTTKQRRFVEEYVGGANFNATEAARRAGYSEKTAHATGWENLRKPEIAEAVQERLNELSMTAEETLKRLTDWGRGDLSPFLRTTATGDVELDLTSSEAQAHLHLIREIKVIEPRYDEDGNEVAPRRVELKLHDAKDAVVQLAKIHGQFIERHEHTGKDGGPIQTEDVTPREKLEERLEGLARRRGSPTTNGTGP